MMFYHSFCPSFLSNRYALNCVLLLCVFMNKMDRQLYAAHRYVLMIYCILLPPFSVSYFIMLLSNSSLFLTVASECLINSLWCSLRYVFYGPLPFWGILLYMASTRENTVLFNESSKATLSGCVAFTGFFRIWLSLGRYSSMVLRMVSSLALSISFLSN